MNNFPPNTEPNTFSLVAILAGVLCVDDYSVDELNSIGNWVILFGQYLLTVAAQQQLIETRIENKNININSKQYKSGGSHFTSPNNKSNQTQRDEVEYLLDAVNKIQKELEKLKKSQ